MSEVITIRVSKEIRAMMKDSRTNWSEDIRNYIVGRAKSIRLHQMLAKIKRNSDRIKVKGDSTSLIAEDRYGT
jgi:hypothetical protein